MNRTERLLAGVCLAATIACHGLVLAAPPSPSVTPGPAKKVPGKKTAAATAATPGPTPAAHPLRPPIYDPYVSGERAIIDTARQCISSGRRLFVSFGTNDCDPCHVAHDALSNPEFREPFFKAFIPVYIDVTEGTENAKFLESYGIDRSKGLPAMAVIEFSPQKATISQKGEYADAAKKGPEAVRVFLSQFLIPETPPTATPAN